MEEKTKKNQVNIELKEEVAQGTYSNLAIITHSSSEFILDFVRVMPWIPKAQVKSRVILTPEHAKRLLQDLNEKIKMYEKMHGPIKKIEGPAGSSNGGPVIPMNFGGPTGQA
ncbi:MAG: DUF3467 domain-containing protein [Bacteroidetes bacterium]|nr:DUF3467 domain-containing protein [Bacteroidota bacterium]